jgi:hypothetical protein
MPRLQISLRRAIGINITGDLEAVRDSLTHVSIMPRATMLLARYELALANTQKYWQRVENFI